MVAKPSGYLLGDKLGSYLETKPNRAGFEMA